MYFLSEISSPKRVLNTLPHMKYPTTSFHRLQNAKTILHNILSLGKPDEDNFDFCENWKHAFSSL